MGKTDVELKTILDKFEATRSELIPILQAAQSSLGYLTNDTMREIARYLSIPESQVYGVASFFERFSFSRRGRREITVCCGTACYVKGARRLVDILESELGIRCGDTTPDLEYSLKQVACVGACALAPVVLVNEDVHRQMEPGKVKGLLAGE